MAPAVCGSRFISGQATSKPNFVSLVNLGCTCLVESRLSCGHLPVSVLLVLWIDFGSDLLVLCPACLDYTYLVVSCVS